jgi:hypothetical protein
MRSIDHIVLMRILFFDSFRQPGGTDTVLFYFFTFLLFGHSGLPGYLIVWTDADNSRAGSPAESF